MIALISESVAFGSELRAPLPPDFNVGYEGITISWYCAKSGTPHPAGINIAYTKLKPQPRRSLQTRNIEIGGRGAPERGPQVSEPLRTVFLTSMQYLFHPR